MRGNLLFDAPTWLALHSRRTSGAAQLASRFMRVRGIHRCVLQLSISWATLF